MVRPPITPMSSQARLGLQQISTTQHNWRLVQAERRGQLFSRCPTDGAVAKVATLGLPKLIRGLVRDDQCLDVFSGGELDFTECRLNSVAA